MLISTKFYQSYDNLKPHELVITIDKPTLLQENILPTKRLFKAKELIFLTSIIADKEISKQIYMT